MTSFSPSGSTTRVAPSAATSSRRSSSGSTLTISLAPAIRRSEEHTSELQSQSNLVCRLLLEKKNNFTYCGISHDSDRLLCDTWIPENPTDSAIPTALARLTRSKTIIRHPLLTTPSESRIALQ